MKTAEQIAWALRKPFPSAEIKTRRGPGGKELSYVDARTVMRRLDEVVGPWGWQTKYHHMGGGRLTCELSVDYAGSWITKSDGAGETQVEGEKGVFSDAFKRAAVQHGIGRFLYTPRRDGSFVTPEEYDAKVPYPEGAA